MEAEPEGEPSAKRHKHDRKHKKHKHKKDKSKHKARDEYREDVLEPGTALHDQQVLSRARRCCSLAVKGQLSSRVCAGGSTGAGQTGQ